jgi:hypothetical protein
MMGCCNASAKLRPKIVYNSNGETKIIERR